MAVTYEVLNYRFSPVAFRIKNDGFVINACDNNGNPATFPLELDDIKYIHSTTNAFRIGLLRFRSEDEEMMYEDVLKMHDWRDIITRDEIENIITSPTTDGLQRLINIENITQFDAVREVEAWLRGKGVDISVRVSDLIKARYSELQTRHIKSSIKITSKMSESNKYEDEISVLKQQLADMAKLVENLTKEKAPADDVNVADKPAVKKKAADKK